MPVDDVTYDAPLPAYADTRLDQGIDDMHRVNATIFVLAAALIASACSRKEEPADAAGAAVDATVAAEAAGVPPSPKLTQGLEIFLNYVWGGAAKFSYVYRQGPSASLAPAGMLVGHIAWADKPAGVLDQWKAYLKGLPADRPPNLYTLYYGVRLSILLQGALDDPWRAWAFALSQQQVMNGTAAGSFLVPVTASHKPGVALSTALSVLTLEHALYLR